MADEIKTPDNLPISYENLRDYTTNIRKIIPKEKELTQTEYNALSKEEQNNGTTYYITDGKPSGGGSGDSVLKSEINGNILVNDEEIQVYDDTELVNAVEGIKGQADALGEKFTHDAGAENNPIFLKNGEFVSSPYELNVNIPTGGTENTFLRGDGQWAYPEYNPEIIISSLALDPMSILTSYSPSTSKKTELEPNKNYQVAYNGYSTTGTEWFSSSYTCTTTLTLANQDGTNSKQILQDATNTYKVINFSTEDYVSPVLTENFNFKYKGTPWRSSSFKNNNVTVKGLGDKFDWGNVPEIRLGDAIQFDTSALGDWEQFNIAFCSRNFSDQSYATFYRTQCGGNGLNTYGFHVEFDNSTKVLTAYPYSYTQTPNNKSRFVFYFDKAYNTAIAQFYHGWLTDWQTAKPTVYPKAMSLKTSNFTISEERFTQLESNIRALGEPSKVIDKNSTDGTVPTSKAVYDKLFTTPVKTGSIASGSNVVESFPGLGLLVLTSVSGVYDVYMIQCSTGNSVQKTGLHTPIKNGTGGSVGSYSIETTNYTSVKISYDGENPNYTLGYKYYQLV